ncbi:hypothetical protein CQ046_20120 [Chryseobacterium sp. MYb7]|uniref:hypothetical protein n=1 Tax=Chryseobacterium sp. MYb7 TaxID=1827290 RepID=UPI000CFFA5D5|nr:hypothetical protein [Chryseobacterium sp. MYb7]PRA97785.1 hypothetical protein CQ046_20120 [Chryseobacterium sp. MYb7]
MDDNFSKLYEKIDKVLENQKLILEKLNQNPTFYSSNSRLGNSKTKPKSTKAEIKEEIREYVQLKIHYGPMLQRKFNLATEPHINRIKE